MACFLFLTWLEAFGLPPQALHRWVDPYAISTTLRPLQRLRLAVPFALDPWSRMKIYVELTRYKLLEFQWVFSESDHTKTGKISILKDISELSQLPNPASCNRHADSWSRCRDPNVHENTSYIKLYPVAAGFCPIGLNDADALALVHLASSTSDW